jgi:hypothetical protein
MLLFVLHELSSIIDDSDSVVSSVVSSNPTLLLFHMLAGNLDRAPSIMPLSGSDTIGQNNAGVNQPLEIAIQPVPGQDISGV